MVKINRSPLPPGMEIKKEDDYRSGPVYDLIKSDFHEKCYICEDLAAKAIHIEHCCAHRGSTILKYDWNNLFYSCYHCNHLKGKNYNNIIDCTQVDPELFFDLEIADELITSVIITKTKDTQGADETIDLLNRIFNGDKTSMMSDECIYLRKEVRETVRVFLDMIEKYTAETDSDLKAAFGEAIKNCLSRKTVFAAFKRSIIRNNRALFSEFCGALL